MGVLSRSFHGSLHGSLYMEVWMFISPSCKAEWWGTLWNFLLFKRLPIPTYLQIHVLQTPPNLHIYLQTLLRKRLPSPHVIGLRASLAWRNHWAYFKPGEGTGWTDPCALAKTTQGSYELIGPYFYVSVWLRVLQLRFVAVCLNL